MHTAVSVYLLDGKVLLVGGKVAISGDCCCGTETNGACCRDAYCTIQTEIECIALGGTFQGLGTDCEPNPCFSGCSDCFGITPFCVDDDGNCWTGFDPTLPSPFCFGEIVDCFQQFLTQITTCVDDPPGCLGGDGIIETINPETCVDTSTGAGCFSCNARNELLNPYIACM